MYVPKYKAMLNYRNRDNASKVYPVHLRITINNVQKYHPVAVPQKVREEQWTDKDGMWVKNTHPFSFEINEAIKEKIETVQELIRRYFKAKKTLTFPIIFKELEKSFNSNSFITYFEYFIKDPPEKFEEGTIGRYSSCLKLLKKFEPSITFNDLSDELMLGFKKYCEQNGELKSSTIRGYFNAIKKVVYWSRKQHHITKDHEQAVFEDVHIPVKKGKKEYLEVDEISAWKNFSVPDKYKSFEYVRDIFLFQIYTGLYYSDIKALLKTELKVDAEFGAYLLAERFKIENTAIIPLWKFPNAKNILLKYKSNDPDKKLLFDDFYFMEDQVFNRKLKWIAAQLGWQRNVYNKLGRKTNTQLYVRYGAERPIVSKMLGHEKEETTNEYFEINLRDVIEGTRRVDFERFDI